MPDGLITETDGPDRLTIRVGSAALPLLVSTTMEQLTVAWSGAAETAISGQAQVLDTGSGASSVDVVVGVPAASDGTVNRLLDETAERLRGEVADNFTAG